MSTSTSYQDDLDEYLGVLRFSEPWWRDHFELLESHGYRLRPRYKPGWEPSWKKSGQTPWLCEDHVINTVSSSCIFLIQSLHAVAA